MNIYKVTYFEHSLVDKKIVSIIKSKIFEVSSMSSFFYNRDELFHRDKIDVDSVIKIELMPVEINK